ncbi:MAG TPA: glutathione binding-like protein, partial [Telluria sp.]
KNFSPLFRPDASDSMLAAARASLAARFGTVAAKLDGRDYLTGARFTVADAYLFTVLGWAPLVQVDLSPWPPLLAFHQRVAARPAVQRVMRDEGLLK